jgi:hypothetical protein
MSLNNSQKIIITNKDKNFVPDLIEDLESGIFNLGEGEYTITVSPLDE